MSETQTNKGYFVEPDAAMVSNPVTNGTVVLQTTTQNGRTAGHLYRYLGAGSWEDITTGFGTGTVTNTGTLTADALMLGNGGTDITALGSLGTTTTLLHGNAAGAPTFAAVSLTADVTGTLAAGNGGTGIAALGTGVATFLGTPSNANLAAAVTGGPTQAVDATYLSTHTLNFTNGILTSIS